MMVERTAVEREQDEDWHRLVAQTIVGHVAGLDREIFDLHCRYAPQLRERYSARDVELYLRDTRSNLEALAASISLITPDVFADYMDWLGRLLASLNIGVRGLPLYLRCVRETLDKYLPATMHPLVDTYIRAGEQQLGAQSE